MRYFTSVIILIAATFLGHSQTYEAGGFIGGGKLYW